MTTSSTGDVAQDRRILDAAKRLFFERGFDAVSVDELGRAAGTAGPRIYAHFDGKGEVLAVLFDEAIDRLLSTSSTPDPTRPALEQLEALALAHARFALADRELLSVYAREERSLPEAHRRRLRRRQRRYVDRWTAVLAALDSEAGPATLKARAHLALGLLNATAHWPDEARDAPQLEAMLARAAVRAVVE